MLAAITLILLVLPTLALGQIDSVIVDFPLGSAVIAGKYPDLSDKKIIGIFAGADATEWIGVSQNRSVALDGGLIIRRGQAIGKACGLTHIPPIGILADQVRQAKLYYYVVQPADPSKAILDSLNLLKQQLGQIDLKLSKSTPEKNDQRELKLILGAYWLVREKEPRNNFGGLLGLQFSPYNRVVVEFAGGLNPSPYKNVKGLQTVVTLNIGVTLIENRLSCFISCGSLWEFVPRLDFPDLYSERILFSGPKFSIRCFGSLYLSGAFHPWSWRKGEHHPSSNSKPFYSGLGLLELKL
jgi:hypothetical protein